MVRRIYRFAKLQHYKVRSELLKVFHALPLDDMKNSDQIKEEHRENNKALTHKEKLLQKLTKREQRKSSRKQKKVYILNINILKSCYNLKIKFLSRSLLIIFNITA